MDVRLDIEPIPHGLIVKVCASRVDAAAALAFRDAFRQATAKTEGARIILDMEVVTFLDSSSLGTLVGMRKSLGQDRQLELTNFSPLVDKVLRLTAMDKAFAIHPNKTAALNLTPLLVGSATLTALPLMNYPKVDLAGV